MGLPDRVFGGHAGHKMTTPNSQVRPVAAPRNDLSRPTRRRLARVGVALATAPLLVLAACSSNDAPVANDTASVAGTVGASGETVSPPASTMTSAPNPAPTTAQEPQRTESKLNVTITDPELGHVVKPLRIVRNMPWPEGSPVSEKAFELAAVEVQYAAGSRYTAGLSGWMLTLKTPTSSYVAPAPAKEFGSLLGQPLPDAVRSGKTTGWLYYKINRGGALTPVSMTFHRPEYFISTTKKSLPRAAFTAVLVK